MAKTKRVQVLDKAAVTVLFAGDSGDGMQLTGTQFTDTTAMFGRDVATLPDFPAEIRAPAGTLAGVSSFKLQFSEEVIYTPGDEPDVLVAMNPAALAVHINDLKKGSLVILNEDAFTPDNLRKAGFATHPITDDRLADCQVLQPNLSQLTANALADTGLGPKEIERCKNFFALGMMFWLYNLSMDHTIQWIQDKFAKKPQLVDANSKALVAGYNYADITETIAFRYTVGRAALEPGTYRKVSGNEAVALGLITAAHLAGKTLFYGSYPITPASDILHELARHKRFGVKTFQAEDEIAAVAASLGACFGGHIGVTGTSGPGFCLKSEVLGLAIMVELPLIVVDVQRAGPSTGMPTKTEQADLLQVMFGRNGESPVCVLAPSTPADCFDMAVEAVRIAVKHMTPVVVLSDSFLGNSSGPWKLPEMDRLPVIEVPEPKANGHEEFEPYRRDPVTLARPWATPGMAGYEHRIGGLSKHEVTGTVSYDGLNHQNMIALREDKIQKIAYDVPELAIRGTVSGPLLVLGWGSTYGAIYEAVGELRREGAPVSQAHLHYLNPFPLNLGSVLASFDRVLIPELNTGQLLMLVRDAFPTVDSHGLHKIQGTPFRVHEIRERIEELL